MDTWNYLALGDSYTIGESVALSDSFPFQLVQLLRKAGRSVSAPEIIAKTGWTTDELQLGIEQRMLLPAYDLVTLLIGVNNQYRGRSAENYAHEFEHLLTQAIGFAMGSAARVVVLSIPDWGYTPYAAERDRKKISGEIDAYNAIKRNLTQQFGAHFIDITVGAREAAVDGSLLAEDGLHPSGKAYMQWAAEIAGYVKKFWLDTS